MILAEADVEGVIWPYQVRFGLEIGDLQMHGFIINLTSLKWWNSVHTTDDIEDKNVKSLSLAKVSIWKATSTVVRLNNPLAGRKTDDSNKKTPGNQTWFAGDSPTDTRFSQLEKLRISLGNFPG